MPTQRSWRSMNSTTAIATGSDSNASSNRGSAAGSGREMPEMVCELGERGVGRANAGYLCGSAAGSGAGAQAALVSLVAGLIWWNSRGSSRFRARKMTVWVGVVAVRRVMVPAGLVKVPRWSWSS